MAAAVLFILGLTRDELAEDGAHGIIWAGVGMLVAVVATFFSPEMSNYLLMVIAVVIGGSIAYVAGRRVAMTDMPQMVAIYNGMGGGAAALIAAERVPARSRRCPSVTPSSAPWARSSARCRSPAA